MMNKVIAATGRKKLEAKLVRFAVIGFWRNRQPVKPATQ